MEKVIKLLGSIFLAVGGTCLLFGLAILLFIRDGNIAFGVLGLLCFIFSCIGGGMLLGASAVNRRSKRIIKNGTRYTGKIYSYIEDQSVLINNAYPINIVVHYFDKEGIEREVTIPTKFTKGSESFPIGATIDFVIYKSSSAWIKDSVRFDHIDREEELMDNKPLNPTKLNLIAVTCPTCSASYKAAQGFAATCPYCGHSVNL